MYILTRAEPLENCKGNIYRVHDAEVERQYLDAGYQVYERSYKLKSQNKDYIVACPEFRKRKGGAPPVVLIPDFLVPGRQFPVYIYMYAIGLYTDMPEKGQRWAAEETRKRFGLASFAHTTLGRALKSFVRCTGGEAAAVEEEAAAAEEEAAAPDGRKGAVFPKARQTEASRRQAASFLGGMPLWEGKRQFADASLGLARDFFVEYQRFLL